ncbi:metallophosphoesterase [soil metagenome]
MRILITADLHLEATGPEPIRRLVAGMSRESPDAIVIAGDIGNPARLFEQCLNAFLRTDCPVAVVPGNHDLWHGPGETSAMLYNEILPEITKSMGYHWLEDGPLIFDNGVAIAGSIAWYDYSSRDPSLNQTEAEIAAAKPRYAMDAVRVDWELTDQEFAAQCRTRLQKQMLALEENEKVKSVLAITHVPVFESQIERNPEDEQWARGNPYFGHLTMGEALRGFTKLRYIVSGHTHLGLNGVVERPGIPIGSAVVGSDYGKPRWVTVEID